MIRPLRTLLALILPLALWAGCASTAPAGVNDYCTTFDADDNDLLYEDEFGVGLYDTWDADEDGFLSDDEFGVGIDTYDTFGAWDGYYDAWDTDDDGLLSDDEFGVGFESTGFYGTWDADASGYLDANECVGAF